MIRSYFGAGFSQNLPRKFNFSLQIHTAALSVEKIQTWLLMLALAIACSKITVKMEPQKN